LSSTSSSCRAKARSSSIRWCTALDSGGTGMGVVPGSSAGWRSCAVLKEVHGVHAGLTSPNLRPSVAMSSGDRPLTIRVSIFSASARCRVVASMAFVALATATLKCLNDGAPHAMAPRHWPPSAVGASGARNVT
jgi:hypothetical protein